MTNTPIFVAQYALFNIFLYLTAFLFAPVGSGYRRPSGDQSDVLGDIKAAFNPKDKSKGGAAKGRQQKPAEAKKLVEMPSVKGKS